MDQKPAHHSLRESVFDEPLYTTDEVAVALGIKKTTVREKIRRGELVALPMGRSYLITQTALRTLKRNLQLMADLARRQAREPFADWEITDCILCGESPLLTTSHTRLDATGVLCEACAQAILKPDGSTGLTKDAWERLTALQVAERNRLAERRRQEDRKEYPELPELPLRPWRVHHCVICQWPYPLSVTNITDPGFYPPCTHSSIFTSDENLKAQEVEQRLLDDLAYIEAETRNWLYSGEPDESYWQVVTCRSCRRLPGVANRPMRLIGYAMCRSCWFNKSVNKQEVSVSNSRVNLIIKELKYYEPYLINSVKVSGRECCWGFETDLLSDNIENNFSKCGGYDIVINEVDLQEKLVLTWCKNKSNLDRKNLAKNYIEQHKLPKLIGERLLSEVLHHDADDLPFFVPDLDDFVRTENWSVYTRR